MNKIVKILMKRDDMTRGEAEEMLAEVRQMFADCEYETHECEDILLEELGLELDFVPDVLFD